MSHVTLEQVLRLAEQLSPSERATLIQHLQEMPQGLSATGERDNWLAFIERTAGILADDPIERPPQGDYETRDPLT